MFKNYKLKYILLLILILGVFVMPSNFFGNMTKNIIDHIKYRGTLVTGEVTVDNENGTYDVKINNASSAYKSVETVTYGAMFSVGEIVVIGYEYGNKELPKILGHSKKIPQEPYEVEVDYSGGCAGVQTKTVTIYSDITKNKSVHYYNYVLQGAQSAEEMYLIVHKKTEGNNIDNILEIGQYHMQASPPVMKAFRLFRCLLFFDLSAIPANVNITSAILSIYVSDNSNVEQNFYIVIQDGQPNYPHNPVINGDYYYANYKNNGGQIATSGISTSSYTNIPLDINGRNWINPNNMTKLCLRSSRDIAAIMPVYGTKEFIEIDNSSNKPKLTITYEI